MKTKSPKRNILLDRLHKGFVITCIGLTAYGLFGLGYKWYQYVTVIKPAAEERRLLEKKDLLAEGSSDLLRDKAANINV